MAKLTQIRLVSCERMRARMNVESCIHRYRRAKAGPPPPNPILTKVCEESLRCCLECPQGRERSENEPTL